MNLEDYIGYDAYEERLVDKYEQEHTNMKSFVITTVYNIPEIIEAFNQSEALEIWGKYHAFHYGIIKTIEELKEN
ncbi:MAG: hypothetical protein IKP65_02025 [Alphaproteobacteria bacterium]|nr:hypothetical protein [Alphaproteobacteria bacterium]